MELGKEERAEQTILQQSQQIQPQQFRSAQKPSTSSGAGTIDKILRTVRFKISIMRKERKRKRN